MRTGFVRTICHCIDITAKPSCPRRVRMRHLKSRKQTAIVQSRHPSLTKPSSLRASCDPMKIIFIRCCHDQLLEIKDFRLL
ncbi:hypothetical protein INR49_010593 [Caranx melampygus]|nr:hypothetical protein INR49_010593 [Caranx melampygus]